MTFDALLVSECLTSVWLWCGIEADKIATSPAIVCYEIRNLLQDLACISTDNTETGGRVNGNEAGITAMSFEKSKL
jgi:hypothetical protein